MTRPQVGEFEVAIGGYPPFVSRSAWFREYVGELYPVRLAIRRAIKQQPNGRLVCEWGWGKNAFEVEPRPEGWLPKPPETCDYADSPQLVGPTPAEVERLGKLRPIVLDLKLKIFETYRDALSRVTTTSPWEGCRKLLKEELLHEDAQFLLAIDRRLGGENVDTGMLPRPIEGWPPGGLSCIFESVVFLEVELRSRLLSGIYETLKKAGLIAPGPIEPGRPFLTISSYYQAIETPAQAVLDQCVDRFLGFKDAPDSGYLQARRMIQETLREDLKVPVALTRLIPQRHASAYRQSTVPLLDAQVSSIEHTGQPLRLCVVVPDSGPDVEARPKLLGVDITNRLDEEDARVKQRKSASNREGPKWPFPISPETAWENVIIRAHGDQRVRISLGGMELLVTYSEMGMANLTNNRPNLQWRLLQTFFQEGQITWKTRGAASNLKDTKRRLSRALRNYFPDIPGDPFKLIDRRKGWAPRFQVRTDPSPSSVGIPRKS